MKVDDEVKVEQVRGRTLFDVLYSIIGGLFSILLIPFNWAKKGIAILKEDNAKIESFRKWHKKQRIISRRQRKLNDEI
jgi:hypothetical protein